MNERAGKRGQYHPELIREEVTPSGARFILSVQLEGVGTTPTVDFGNVGLHFCSTTKTGSFLRVELL